MIDKYKLREEVVFQPTTMLEKVERLEDLSNNVKCEMIKYEAMCLKLLIDLISILPNKINEKALIKRLNKIIDIK